MSSTTAATERIDSPFARRPVRAESAVVPLPALRPMTGHEEEVVERRRGEADMAGMCNEIVARCLVAPGADATEALARVRALPIALRDVALLTVRRLSFGEQVRSTVDCPACKRSEEVEFDLRQLPVELGQIPAQLEVAVEGVPVVLRLPTAADQEALAEAAPETEAQRRSLLLSRLILRWGDRTGSFDQEFARGLTVGARRALEQAVEESAPRLDLAMAVTCGSCGHAYRSPFDVATFFLPS